MRQNTYNLKQRFCENVSGSLFDDIVREDLHSQEFHLPDFFNMKGSISGVHSGCDVRFENRFSIFQGSVDNRIVCPESDVGDRESELRKLRERVYCICGRAGKNGGD